MGWYSISNSLGGPNATSILLDANGAAGVHAGTLCGGAGATGRSAPVPTSRTGIGSTRPRSRGTRAPNPSLCVAGSDARAQNRVPDLRSQGGDGPGDGRRYSRPGAGGPIDQG